MTSTERDRENQIERVVGFFYITFDKCPPTIYKILYPKSWRERKRKGGGRTKSHSVRTQSDLAIEHIE